MGVARVTYSCERCLRTQVWIENGSYLGTETCPTRVLREYVCKKCIRQCRPRRWVRFAVNVFFLNPLKTVLRPSQH